MNPNAATPLQPQPELLQYIQTELSQGYTIDQIAIAARSSGWSDQQIEICIAWINNEYANRQMAVSQTYASNAQYTAYTPKPQKKRIAGLLGSLFIVAMILIASVLIYSAITSKSTDALLPMVQKNLTSASFQRSLTTTLKDTNATLTAVARCDFSQPAEPKADIQMEVVYPIGNARNSLSQMSVQAEAVVIGDTAWIRINDTELLIDDSTRASYAALTASGETTDAAIKAYYGIQNVDTWVQHFGFNLYNEDASNQTLQVKLLPYVYGLSTIFNDVLIGNFGTQSTSILSSIKKLNLYSVKTTSPNPETFNNASTYVSEVSLNRAAYSKLSQELDSTLNLSERHMEQLKNGAYTGLIGDFRVWIDEKGTLYKIASLDNATVIEYKDFGATYNIQAPESDTDLENLRSIQEDLRRFPN